MAYIALDLKTIITISSNKRPGVSTMDDFQRILNMTVTFYSVFIVYFYNLMQVNYNFITKKYVEQICLSDNAFSCYYNYIN